MGTCPSWVGKQGRLHLDGQRGAEARRDRPRRVRCPFQLGRKPQLAVASGAIATPDGQTVRRIVPIVAGHAEQRDARRSLVVVQVGEVEVLRNLGAARRTDRAVRGDQLGAVAPPFRAVEAPKLLWDRHWASQSAVQGRWLRCRCGARQRPAATHHGAPRVLRLRRCCHTVRCGNRHSLIDARDHLVDHATNTCLAAHFTLRNPGS